MYLAEALSPEDYVRHIQMEKQQQQWLAGHDERLDKFRQKMIRRQKQVLCLAWISAWFVRTVQRVAYSAGYRHGLACFVSGL